MAAGIDVREWLEMEAGISADRGSLFPLFANSQLLAQILHQRYPKAVNIHKFVQKPGSTANMINWFTLKCKKYLMQLK